MIGFLKGLPQTHYQITTRQDDDIQRPATLLDTYVDSRLDFVDAAIIALAERMNITRILTIDRRDFTLVRPRHAEHFELLP